MYRVQLRKQTEVIAPALTGPHGLDEHTHEILAGSTRTEESRSEFDPHFHEISPGSAQTEPGGFDGHTHSVPTMAKREILDGEMIFLSLVDAGANHVVPIMKDGRPLQRYEAVAKIDKEGLLYNLVYGPDIVDTWGDFASREAVQKIAHKFIPNMVGSGIDVMHNCKPVDPKDAHICESFIIQKNGDDRFKGVAIDGRVIEDTSELEGWWASIIKLNAPHLRAPFESGEWTGVSMYGPALVQSVQKSDFTQALADRLGNPPHSKETDMNPTELAEALKKALAPVIEKVEAIAKSVQDTQSEPAPTNPPAYPDPVVEIEFEGDLDNLEDVEAHEEKLFRASLDFNKPADLKKWKAYIAKRAENKPADSDELTKAKADAEAANRRVADLAKASNQPADDVKTNETAVERQVRIRKFAKETAQGVLKSQGR